MIEMSIFETNNELDVPVELGDVHFTYTCVNNLSAPQIEYPVAKKVVMFIMPC